jgi:hypothetical protein
MGIMQVLTGSVKFAGAVFAGVLTAELSTAHKFNKSREGNYEFNHGTTDRIWHEPDE